MLKINYINDNINNEIICINDVNKSLRNTLIITIDLKIIYTN